MSRFRGTLAGCVFIIVVVAATAFSAAKDDFKRGEALYRQNCAKCHGGDLKGRGMAPSLIGVTEHMTDEEIVAHARMIGDTMCCARNILKLTDSEFDDILAYFHAVDDGKVKVRERKASARGGG